MAPAAATSASRPCLLSWDKGHRQGTAPGTSSGCTDLLPARLPSRRNPLLDEIPASPSPEGALRCRDGAPGAADVFASVLSAASPSHQRWNSFQELLIILGTSASQQRSKSYPGLRYQLPEFPGASFARAPQETIPGRLSMGTARPSQPQNSPIPGRNSLSRPHLCPWGWALSVLTVRQQNPGRSIPSGNPSSDPPSFPAEMQIRERRTRDLWTQQYLCIPAKVRGRGNHRGFFPLGNNETVNEKLSRDFCSLLKSAIPRQVQKRSLTAFQLVISN